MAAQELQTSDTDLPPEELSRRVAILRRFRELLREQRNRFREYLEVLDKQRDVIVKGDTEALLSHVELEEKIITDIFSIQKVIDPLEVLYQSRAEEPETEVPNLKAALEDLKTEAITRSERNRELLKRHMDKIRTEIKQLRNNPFAVRRSLYDDSGSASLVDLKG